jgi:hypothetical protein
VVLQGVPAPALGRLLVVVGVDVGWLLFEFSRVLLWLISLSLLATIRGGTSFLCQTATKKRSKENALQPLILKWPERAVSTVWDFRKTLGAKPRTVETLPLREQIPTRFATSVCSR